MGASRRSDVPHRSPARAKNINDDGKLRPEDVVLKPCMSARTENWQSGPSGTPLPSARILVVDDRPTSRAVVKGVLSSSAYVVEEADSGATALQLIEEQGYDLVKAKCRVSIEKYH